MRARALLVGWFSLPWSGATAGDIAVKDVVSRWLDEEGIAHDVALDPPFEGGVDWRAVSPSRYTHVVHVCGPVGPEMAVARILERFPDAALVAINASAVADPAEWNPFVRMLARDGQGQARPDLALDSAPRPVPVIGVIRVHPQAEYAGGRHSEVDAAIDALLARRNAAAVPIDTRLDVNEGGLRSVEELAALVGRMDAVVTSRLHGLVFALRAGVPALAIDPVAGGAKVATQAATLGWDIVTTADRTEPATLDALLDSCLDDGAGQQALAAAQRGREQLSAVRSELVAALREGGNGSFAAAAPARVRDGLRRLRGTRG